MKLRILTVLLACCVTLAQATELTLPTRKEIRSYVREVDTGPCERCAEVAAIETLPGQKIETNPSPTTAIPGQPLHGVQPVPILTKDARAARRNMTTPPPDTYRVIVRNDDGTYTAHEQETQPDFIKGDRVRITPEGLVRYP